MDRTSDYREMRQPFESEDAYGDVRQKKTEGWFAYLKRHTPAIISLISVAFNIVILSVIIPGLRRDVAFMQGQTASIQSQANSMVQTLVSLSGQIDGAGTEIKQFYDQLDGIEQQFNATEAAIQTQLNETRIELATMRDTSHNIITQFERSSSMFQQQLNVSLDAAVKRAFVIHQEVEGAQKNVSVTLVALEDLTVASLASVHEANVSVVNAVSALRDDFEGRIVPNFVAEMRALNVTNAIVSLQSASTVLNGIVLLQSADIASLQSATVNFALPVYGGYDTGSAAADWQSSLRMTWFAPAKMTSVTIPAGESGAYAVMAQGRVNNLATTDTFWWMGIRRTRVGTTITLCYATSAADPNQAAISRGDNTRSCTWAGALLAGDLLQLSYFVYGTVGTTFGLGQSGPPPSNGAQSIFAFPLFATGGTITPH